MKFFALSTIALGFFGATEASLHARHYGSNLKVVARAESSEASTAAAIQKTVAPVLEEVKPLMSKINETVAGIDVKSLTSGDEKKLVKTLKPLLTEVTTALNGTVSDLKKLSPPKKTSSRRARRYDISGIEEGAADTVAELISTVETVADVLHKELAGLPILGPVIDDLLNSLNPTVAALLATVGSLLEGVLDLVFNLLNDLGLLDILNDLGVLSLVDGLLKDLGLTDLLAGLPVLGPLLGSLIGA